jgi:predicted SprT family Zn-dependent metalloprotease
VWQRTEDPAIADQLMQQLDEMQQPIEKHVMHESGRWRLFPYECTCQADSMVATIVGRQAAWRRGGNQSCVRLV